MTDGQGIQFGDEYQAKKRTKVRRSIYIILVSVVLLTAIEVFIQQERVRTPIASNILVFSLLNIILILLGILVLLLLRSLIKLFFERRSERIGTKFQTKLVVAFITLTLVPSALLFLVASKLFNYSIDNWFNLQVETTLSDSMDVARNYYSRSAQKALFFSEQTSIRVEKALKEKNFHMVERIIRNKIEEYGVDGIKVFDSEGAPVAEAWNKNLPQDVVFPEFSQSLQRGLKGESFYEMVPRARHNFIFGIYSMKEGDNVAGVVAIMDYMPERLVAQIEKIKANFEEYKQHKMLKSPMKAGFMITFLMITLLILFAATWFGFYLAKGITVPIQELALATKEIAKGRLDFKIGMKANDEIGILVDSFNQMVDDLNRSNKELESRGEDLRRSNIELEKRRNYIETILENIAAGVISIDKLGKINMINYAAANVLKLDADAVYGMNYKDVFDLSHLESVRKLIRKMKEKEAETIEEQINLTVSGQVLTFLINVSVLRDAGRKYMGTIVVFEDLTELIKTQKVAAWREVARGIAHEIKNPLTPIQLNTQRLRKKFKENAADFNDIFDSCTKTIIKEVDDLKELVNSFSRFASMPEANLRLDDFHECVMEVVQLYQGAQKDLFIEKRLDERIGKIRIDREQMKRVFINLIDNAISAMNGSGRIIIRTELDEAAKRVRVEVTDNGEGISPKNRDKLFLPYFTTKKKGTGLGLAIASRIIADHNGSITLKSSKVGETIFLIDLPV
ncbi:MAG: HAMP domain-containing protein [Nitrospinae bacterium]|nr:HAMP domain-containing protein [Nitrospinota bacterium]